MGTVLQSGNITVVLLYVLFQPRNDAREEGGRMIMFTYHVRGCVLLAVVVPFLK